MPARTYYVARDAAGTRNSRLSRPVAKRTTCRRVLKRIQRTHPDCFMVEVERFR